MVRKYSKKTRSNTRTTSRTKKKSQIDTERQHEIQDAPDLDYTLPDGNHLDFFDHLRSDK